MTKATDKAQTTQTESAELATENEHEEYTEAGIEFQGEVVVETEMQHEFTRKDLLAIIGHMRPKSKVRYLLQKREQVERDVEEAENFIAKTQEFIPENWEMNDEQKAEQDDSVRTAKGKIWMNCIELDEINVLLEELGFIEEPQAVRPKLQISAGNLAAFYRITESMRKAGILEGEPFEALAGILTATQIKNLRTYRNHEERSLDEKSSAFEFVKELSEYMDEPMRKRCAEIFRRK